MAKFAIETTNALTKKLWQEKLFRDTRKASYFERFMKESSDGIIEVKTELTKSQGDKITFGIRKRLSGTGVTSGTVLEGNEEALATHDDSVSLEQYRHAVRDRGKLDRQRAVFKVTEESKDALKDWGSEKIDALCFDAILSGNTRIAYKTSSGFQKTTADATAKAAMDATNSKLTATFLRQLHAYATTGGNRTFTPLRPVKIDGKMYYVLLVHPDAEVDLLEDANIRTAWENAAERGNDNPLFKYATVVYGGICVHSHENCTIGLDGGGAAVPYGKGVLMGAQSLVWAWGERPNMVQETFDYENEIGTAWEIIAGVKRPTFNSEVYGSVGVYYARTRISD